MSYGWSEAVDVLISSRWFRSITSLPCLESGWVFSSAGWSEPLDIRIVEVFFYLYLPNPRSHVLPPLAAITLLCLAPREERKNKGEKRGKIRARSRLSSSSFLFKNWLDFLSSLHCPHLMDVLPCFGWVLGPAISPLCWIRWEIRFLISKLVSAE